MKSVTLEDLKIYFCMTDPDKDFEKFLSMVNDPDEVPMILVSRVWQRSQFNEEKESLASVIFHGSATDWLVHAPESEKCEFLRMFTEQDLTL
jgi:hypothetical protein